MAISFTFTPFSQTRRCKWMVILLLGCLCLAPPLRAENKVLFIGNSFTYGYGSTTGVPDLFDRLAQAGGQDDPVTLMRTIPGADFQGHAGHADTLAAINSQPWTHVVLQGNSSEPTHLTPNDGRSIADHLTYGRALYNQVMANHSASKVVLFETWSRGASHPDITGTSTDTTFESTAQFQDELRTNYRLLRDNLNNEFPDAPPVAVGLVGSAWELAGALLPLNDPDFVDLFMANETPDYGYHANDRGTYLAACVFYAKIYESSPEGLHVDPLISSLNLNFGAEPGMPAYLESVAWEMVANGTDPPTTDDQPMAVGDFFTIDEDTALDGDVSLNDTIGVDGGTYSVVTEPLHGVLTLASVGTFTYVPDAHFNGGDSFVYRITDSDGDISEAKVTLDVTDVNEAPVAVGQQVEVPEDGSVGIELLGSDPDGDSFDYTLKVFPSHGTLSGTIPSFTYTPNPGYHGPDLIGYVLNDGQLDSEPAEITITVISNAPAGFDEWMAGFGMTGQPSQDADGGGLDNLTEFLFGYDPTNPSDDLLFRLELVLSDGTVNMLYPELMPVGDFHLCMAAELALLADPASRVETITKAQIEAMTGAERSSQTYLSTLDGGPMFFRLEFVPPPLE